MDIIDIENLKQIFKNKFCTSSLSLFFLFLFNNIMRVIYIAHKNVKQTHRQQIFVSSLKLIFPSLESPPPASTIHIALVTNEVVKLSWMRLSRATLYQLKKYFRLIVCAYPTLPLLDGTCTG